jgi:hypothetical protein
MRPHVIFRFLPDECRYLQSACAICFIAEQSPNGKQSRLEVVSRRDHRSPDVADLQASTVAGRMAGDTDRVSIA